MTDQIERDLDRQFRNKLTAAVEHIADMYEVAGLEEGKAFAAVAVECLRMAVWIISKNTKMPRDELFGIIGGMFDSAREFQQRKQDGV